MTASDSRSNRLTLTLRVHADAFTTSPWEYLKAVFWRVRGYRVRARGRMAALTARSPNAYDLWIARDEEQARAGFEPVDAVVAAIIPVIDMRGGAERLQDTLDSLCPAGREKAVLLGPVQGSPIPSFADWSGLASAMEPSENWICVVNAGDRLARDALSIYAGAVARNPGCRIIYADDDLVDGERRRTAPHFKPNWNPELFEHHDFLTGSAIVQLGADALRALGASPARALIDRGLEVGPAPVHLPLVLHHRRTRQRPLIPAKAATRSAGGLPTVSVIIPTRNQLALLRDCVDGLRRTDHSFSDRIIVDNGSDDPDALAYLKALEADGFTVLRMPGPFNYSALNNRAVEHVRGEMLCFLNNDVEMKDDGWLSQLTGHAGRADIGAVGPCLLYPDGTIQHAGVVIGIGGGAAHAHRLQRTDEPGYFDRARLPQRVSAVTAACLVVERHKFLDVGGFDEVDFPVAFNDVDLCLKLNAKGWQSFYEPRATLIHHESKSRGRDTGKVKKARFAGELAALKRKWHTDERVDPYHHPNLSRYTEQFLLSV